MFDMEILNDALNMPLPLFSTGKGRGNRLSTRLLSLPGERASLPLPLSSSFSPILLFEQCLFKQNERSHRSNRRWVNPTSSSEPVDRLPVRIDSGAMRCRTFSATPPAIPPIIPYPPSLPPCLFNHAFV